MSTESVVEMVPSALQECKSRTLPDGSVITFEFAPAGSLTQDGEIRQRDWRVYFYTAQPACPPCEGTGRVPSEKRPGGTVKCSVCGGSGETKRERMISVTTLLGSISPKPGLPWWSEARGIEGAVTALRLGEITVDTHPADGVEIVRALRLGADRARDTAADRGLNVHGLLEEYMKTGEPPRLADHPVEHHGYIQALCSWLLKTDPEPELVEELVCEPEAGYAGRSDLVARAGGMRIRYDAKTSDRAQIFSSAHTQLGLYERAGLTCGDEPSDELRVIVFAANGEWREMPCEATPKTVDAALAFFEQIRPIDSLCEAANRHERKARKA